MVEEETLFPESTGNTMLQEAIEALRQGDRARAKDLLTRLLKADQNNVTYWVWLSAAVDTQKERIYCLQTALQLDPDNAAAKRGLVLLGALPPDETVAPFPLNHPRLWEEKLVIVTEEARPKRSPTWRKPLLRLGLVLGVSLVLVGLVYVGFLIPNRSPFHIASTPTHRPTRTPTFAPTRTPSTRTVTATFIAPTPLWMLLPATYTPTPLYVVTPHPVTSMDAFNAAMRYFSRHDYTNTINLMQQILTMEPQAADAYYYIGESYRGLGDDNKALAAYQNAINANPGLAAAFLGRALAKQALDPKADVLSDYNHAIALDPNFALAYTELGAYYLRHGDLKAALRNLQAARNLNPDSALVYQYLAQAQLATGNYSEALDSAKMANSMDLTLLPAYLTLAEAYQANGQLDQAMGPLQTYTLYQPDDVDALTLLGAVYNAKGDHQSAVDVLNRALVINPKDVDANYQRGMAYLNLGASQSAEHDFRVALGYDPTHFWATVGLARAYDLGGYSGNAYLKMEAALGLAKTDAEKAIGYYWEAVFLEKTDDPKNARVKWENLLALPEDAMPPEWRDTALQHLGVTATPTKVVTSTPVLFLSTSTPKP